MSGAAAGVPFVVLSLPRSRSFWLSKFLTYGDWECYHDQARYARGPGDVSGWLGQNWTGTCETGAARWWRVARAVRPEARLVVVMRPLEEVLDSLMRLPLGGIATLDLGVLRRELARQERALVNCAMHTDALVVDFHDLHDEATCGLVFEHCLRLPHDSRHWQIWNAVNAQCNMRAIMRYWLANKPAIQQAGEELRRKYREILGAPHPVFRYETDDGLVFQDEKFEICWRDGEPLAKEHCRAIGEPEDEYLRKNIPLWRKLDSVGALRTVTARQNGRMLGYLSYITSPALDSVNRKSAYQATFFVTQDAAKLGLGLKLQKAGIAVLRAANIDEVFMYAGVRGSGPRIGVLYKRLKAQPFGQYYKLELSGKAA